MKVEQLKAELVVFKGLMSNVSAASASLTFFPCGLVTQAVCSQAAKSGRAGLARCGLLISCLPPLPTLCYASVFSFATLYFRRKRRNTCPLCWRGSVPPSSLELVQQLVKNTDTSSAPPQQCGLG